MRKKIPGRAQLIGEKREFLERVLSAWAKNSDLRLGQFIVCVFGGDSRHGGDFERALFYCEDEWLAERLESFEP